MKCDTPAGGFVPGGLETRIVPDTAAATLANVSVVICSFTEERWDDLIAAVVSVEQQSLPPREIIVVVDYNPDMLARVRSEIPVVLAVANSGPKGVSGGRNTGVAVSSGELIAFLDDDASADRDWLLHLACRCLQPDVLGAGSAVDARWEEPRPVWFPEEFDWVVGCTYRGAPQQAAVVRNLWGGCMCLRREIFDEVGGFTNGIGRVGDKPLGCEDTELCLRATRRWPGRVFVYEPRARISHRVPAKRGRWGYFCRRCYAEGISKARIAREVSTGVVLATEAAYTRSVLPRGVARGLGDAIFRRERAGLMRATAITTGLCLAATGYAHGRIGR